MRKQIRILVLVLVLVLTAVSFGAAQEDGGEVYLPLVAALAPDVPPTGLLDTIIGGTPGGASTAEWIDIEPRSVIGLDERFQIDDTMPTPWRAIAHLEITFPNESNTSLCTGWFVGPHTVITAGHCLYAPGRPAGERWASLVKVTPGKNGSSNPIGSETVSILELHTVSGWFDHALPEYDFGAIILPNDSLGNQVGWFFDYGYYDDAFLSGVLNANIAGYPGDKIWGTLWLDNDSIAAVTTRKLDYSIDTFGGQSGSPVWLSEENRVIAIHTYGVGVNNGCAQTYNNCGTRITLDVAQKLQEWGAPLPFDDVSTMMFFGDNNFQYRIAKSSEPDNYDMGGNISNDKASSIWLKADWSVMVYEHADQQGGKKCITSSDSNLTNDYFDNGVAINDNISSYTLYNDPVCSAASPALPAKPQLTYPANRASGVSATTYFSWNNAANAESYEVEVATSPDFSNMVAGDSVVFGTRYNVSSPLASSTTHYWRVRTWRGFSSSAWSDTWSFTTASSGGTPVPSICPPPSPIEPSDNATTFNRSISFRWSAPNCSNLGGYAFRLNRSADPTASAIVSTNPSGTSYNYTVSSAGTYYWHVASRTSNNVQSSWVSQRINVQTEPNGVQVCRNTGFTDCTTFTADVPRLGHTPVGNDIAKSIRMSGIGGYAAVLYGDEYYRGSHYATDGERSDLNGTDVGYQASSLLIRKRDNPAFTLDPTSGGNFRSDRSIADLDHWDYNDRARAIDVAAGYEVFLCTDAGYSGTCGKTTNDHSELNEVAYGLTGGLSSIYVCAGRCPDPPSAPTLSSPGNGAAYLTGTTVTLNWYDSGGEYEVRLSGGTLTSPRIRQWERSNQWVLSDLAASTTPYSWQVRVRLNGGSRGQLDTSAWSTARTFTVQVVNQSPHAPSDPTPQDNATYVPIDTMLEWSSLGDPDAGDSVTYDVYLATDTGYTTELVCADLTVVHCVPSQPLLPATLYRWKVVATDNHGATTSGAMWNFYTDPHLTTPGNIVASDGDHFDSIQISWGAADGASIYEIWRNTINDVASARQIASTSQRLYEDGTVVPEQTYYYWVRAGNSAGRGAMSLGDSGHASFRATTLNDEQAVRSWLDGVVPMRLHFFDGVAGEWMYTRISTGSGTLNAQLAIYGPDDQLVINKDGPVKLPMSGEYRVEISQIEHTEGRYGLRIEHGFRAGPSDVTRDCMVNIDDLNRVLELWGTSNPDADTDLDGTVEVDDLLNVQNNWNQTCEVDQVILFNEIGYRGVGDWNGGIGAHDGPNAKSYSMLIPAGWSVRTYREDGEAGESRCWRSDVQNFEYYSWHQAIQSIEVFDTNVCVSVRSAWTADYFNTHTCWDDHANCNSQIHSEKLWYSDEPVLLEKNWGTSAPGGSISADNWTGRFTTTVYFPPGIYVFLADHDDGMKLKIGEYGENVHSSKESHKPFCNGNTGYELSGNTPIEIYLREDDADALIKLWWSTDTSVCEPPTPTPTATPVTPTATPVTPTATPVTPTATPVTPTATPVTPTATPVTPTATPVTPEQHVVSGLVYEDGNKNGQQDEGELGIADAEVYLRDPQRSVSQERMQRTNTEGRYRFDEIPTGQYQLGVKLPQQYGDSEVHWQGLDVSQEMTPPIFAAPPALKWIFLPTIQTR